MEGGLEAKINEGGKHRSVSMPSPFAAITPHHPSPLFRRYSYHDCPTVARSYPELSRRTDGLCGELGLGSGRGSA